MIFSVPHIPWRWHLHISLRSQWSPIKLSHVKKNSGTRSQCDARQLQTWFKTTEYCLPTWPYELKSKAIVWLIVKGQRTQTLWCRQFPNPSICFFIKTIIGPIDFFNKLYCCSTLGKSNILVKIPEENIRKKVSIQKLRDAVLTMIIQDFSSHSFPCSTPSIQNSALTWSCITKDDMTERCHFWIWVDWIATLTDRELHFSMGITLGMIPSCFLLYHVCVLGCSRNSSGECPYLWHSSTVSVISREIPLI